MKRLLLLILMMAGTQAFAQKAYKVSIDDDNGQLVCKGPITFDELRAEPKFKWFRQSIADYKPDYHDMRLIADSLGHYKLVVVMGTWCDDSQNLVPKLAYVLDKVFFPYARVSMYGVDRDKSAGGDERERYNISKVPTIILMRNGTEVGRITETVAISVEHDLAELIRQDIARQNP